MTQHSSLALDLDSLEQTRAVGLYLGQTLTPGSVLMLEGDLGAGKTTLVQSIGQGLGITDAITSPTFALIHEYPEGRIPLYHLDLYRLTTPEVTALHLDSYWDGREVPLGIVAIEWPDRLANWPECHLHLTLSYQEQKRRLSLIAHGQQNWPILSSKLQSLSHTTL